MGQVSDEVLQSAETNTKISLLSLTLSMTDDATCDPCVVSIGVTGSEEEEVAG